MWQALQTLGSPFIASIRAEGDLLASQATDAFDEARSTEYQARQHTLDELATARRALPAPAAVTGGLSGVIRAAPGLLDEAARVDHGLLSRRPSPEAIAALQVVEDPNKVRYPNDWRASVASWVTDDRWVGTEILQVEAAILDELWLGDQRELPGLVMHVREETRARFDDGMQAGHGDAFRHAYTSAVFTREFGADWAQRYMTAHEAEPSNPARDEGMDLHNNAVGQRIALEHPDASREELAALVELAVHDGDVIVIGPAGQPAYSDQHAPETTGDPPERTLPGHPLP